MAFLLKKKKEERRENIHIFKPTYICAYTTTKINKTLNKSNTKAQLTLTEIKKKISVVSQDERGTK